MKRRAKDFILKSCTKFLSERKYLELRYFYNHKKFPNIDNPKTFSEKSLWAKLNDFDPIMTTCADKFEVRKFVENKVGSKYLIPLITTIESSDEFENKFDSLPIAFALKASHGSGWNSIVKDKGRVDVKKISSDISYWLNNNYYDLGLERQYKDIIPRMVIEELLLTKDNQVPNDIKVYCFGKGGAKKIVIQIDVDRFGSHARAFYDDQWNKLDFSILSTKSKSYPGEVEKPTNLDEILDLASELSSSFEFSRVDLYELEGKIYFGEITFHPESGYGMFIEPKSNDLLLGELLY